MRRLITALFAVLVGLGVVGWYYSDQILGPDAPKGKTGQTVLGHTDSTITLVASAKARRPGSWAIEWPGGYGKIGPLIGVADDRVLTRFQIAAGTPPDTTSRLAGFAPDADPRTWLGYDFANVTIPARVGRLPAWLVPGTDSTWAIFLHGRAATRAEMLRMLPGCRALELPCLIIEYRNDTGAPRLGNGSYRLGVTEWRDLEDAVQYARSHGARDVVLVGCSMGGSIIAQFLRHSIDTTITRAAVLDAPALDWNALFAMASRQRHVPLIVTDLGKLIASLRTGLQWSEVTQIPHAREFSKPMLIFHGDADPTAPVEVSRRFAALRPDLVTYHEVHGAGHVESSNVNPQWYVATLERWLLERGIGAARSRGPRALSGRGS